MAYLTIDGEVSSLVTDHIQSQNQEVADRKSLKCRCYSNWWFTSDIGLSGVNITGRNRSSDRSKRWKDEEVFLLWSVALLQRMSLQFCVAVLWRPRLAALHLSDLLAGAVCPPTRLINAKPFIPPLCSKTIIRTTFCWTLHFFVCPACILVC